jgi:hypothetical protein
MHPLKMSSRSSRSFFQSIPLIMRLWGLMRPVGHIFLSTRLVNSLDC